MQEKDHVDFMKVMKKSQPFACVQIGKNGMEFVPRYVFLPDFSVLLFAEA